MSEIFLDKLLIFIKLGLFWIAFLVPGMALDLVLKKKLRQPNEDVFGDLPKWFMFSLLLMSPAALISYGFHLKIAFLIAWIALELIASAMIFFAFRSELKEYARFSVKTLKSNPIFWFFVVILLGDLAVSARFGGFLYGDSLVHMGKVTKLLSNGFSFEDPFIKGGIESRYHLNLAYPLYAIPAKVLNLPIHAVWQNSFWFFHSMIFLSFYGFLRKVFSKNLWIPVLTTVGAMALFYGVFAYASVPNTMIMIFIAAILTSLFGLATARDNYQLFMFYAGVIVAALVHPIYSLALALFICFYLFVSALMNWRLDFRRVALFIPAVLILVSTPTISYFMPNYMTEISRDYGLSGGVIIKLNSFLYAKNFMSEWIRPALMVNGAFLFLLLGRLSKRFTKEQLLLLTSLILFPALTVFNPVVFPILYKFMPYWVINRFSTIDLFHFFSLPLLVFLLIEEIKFRKVRVLAVISAMAILFVNFYYVELPKAALVSKISRDYVSRGLSLASLVESLPKSSVIGSPYLEDNFIIPSFKSIYTLTVPEGNASPAVNIEERKRLFNILEKYSGQKDSLTAIKKSDLEYVLVGSEYRAILEDNNNFQLVASQGNKYYLLKIVGER